MAKKQPPPPPSGPRPTRDIKRARDARTGKFVPIREATRRPGTTVVETVKPRPPKK